MRCLVALALVVLGCRPARPAAPPAPADRHGTLPNGGGIPEAASAFEDRVYDYRFVLDPAELAKLNANPAMYDEKRLHVAALATIDGHEVGQVGLRYKGAWGTFRTCLPNADGSGPAEPYHPIPASNCPPVPKFSYKVLFDAYQPGGRFHGLARMNLHNLIRDPSKLHERLAFQLFRDMGIATARTAFARVTVNGVFKGLYVATEDIADRRFLADHWPADQTGILYKQGWPLSVDPKYWREALSTPRKASIEHQPMIAFAGEVMAAGDDPQRLAAALSRWSDPDWLARYMAVDTAVRNVDGVTKLFCSPGDHCFPNNYFWYQTPSQKFLLLPWDLDYTWRVSVRQNHLPPWDLPIPAPGIASCSTRITIDGGPHQPAPCDPIFRGINAYRPLYIAAVKKLLAHPHFTVPALRAQVDRWVEMVKDVVAADQAIPTSGYKAWPTQIALLKTDIAILRARMESVAAGHPYRPFPPTGEWEYPPRAAH